MKKVLTIVLIIFLLIFGYGFKSVFVGAVNDELEGFVEDNGDVGLFHEIDFENNVLKSFIHIRLFSKDSSGKISTIETDSNHILYFSDAKFSFDSNFQNTERSISSLKNPKRFILRCYDKNLNVIEEASFIGNNVKIELYSSVMFVSLDDNRIFSFPIVAFYEDNLGISLFWEYDLNDFPGFLDNLDTIDVRQDYDLLPESEKEFINIQSMNNVSENIYSFSFYKNLKVYKFLVNIPNEIDMNQFIKADGSINISYSTSDGKRYLYMQPDHNLSAKPITKGTLNDPAVYTAGFVSINLTDMTYDIVKKLSMKTILDITQGFYVSAYLFFPIEIEKVYSVRLEYEYRYKYLFFINGDWKKESNLYLWDDKFNLRIPWWMGIGSLGLGYLIAGTVSTMTIFDPIPYDDINSHYRNLYESSGIYDPDFDIKVGCKVQVGNFHKFGSTSVEFKNYATTEMTYLYEGIVYKINEKDLDEDLELPSIKLFFDFKGFFDFPDDLSLASLFEHIANYWKESLFVFGVIFLILKGLRNLFGRRKYKYRFRW